jgi:hypothetical protein
MTQPTKTRLPQNKGIGPATEKRYESALQNERFHNIYAFVNAKETNFLKIVMVHAMLAGLKHVSAVKAQQEAISFETFNKSLSQRQSDSPSLESRNLCLRTTEK